jgi:hypothetical protein
MFNYLYADICTLMAPESLSMILSNSFILKITPETACKRRRGLRSVRGGDRMTVETRYWFLRFSPAVSYS